MSTPTKATPSAPVPQARAAPARTPARWAVRASTRKGLLMTHVVSAGTWIGADVVVGVLVVVAWARGTGAREVVETVLARDFLMPAVVLAAVAGVVCLISGLLLGLATKWGLVRFWWVAVKLVLNTAMLGLLAAFVIPISELGTGRQPVADIWFVLVLAVGAVLALLLAFWLSVFKPWGRVRRPLSRPGRATGTEGL